MYTIMALLFLFLLIVILLAVFRLKVLFTFNSEEYPDFNLKVSWLNSLIKGIVTMDVNKPVLKVYLFNKRILTKKLMASKQKKENNTNKLDLLKTVRPEYMYLETSYGFEDPSVTGMVCGAIDLISVYVGLNDLYNNPDFSTSSSYINISALVELNMLSTLITLLKLKVPNSKMKAIHESR